MNERMSDEDLKDFRGTLLDAIEDLARLSREARLNGDGTANVLRSCSRTLATMARESEVDMT